MVSINEITPADYRYFLVDILTNQTIAEIPFTNVSYERALSKAGSFSGSIPVIEATTAYDLYESTLPGKTALYVLRNGVCVWGGMIWSRQYSPTNKTLQVDGAEWISYFYHRAVWQTLYYGSDVLYPTKYQATGTSAIVFTNGPHGFLQGETVRITGVNPSINGDKVITSVTASSFSFASTAVLPLTNTTSGIVQIVLDSYETTRQILGWLGEDFAGLGFENDETTPATELEYAISTKQASPIAGTSPGESRFTLTTSTVHDFIPGQVMEFVDVDTNVNGYQTVESTPTSNTITVRVDGTITLGSTAVATLRNVNVTSKQIKTVELSVTNKAVTSNIGTMTTSTPHGLAVGDSVSISKIDNSITYFATTSAANNVTSITVSSATNLKPGQLVTHTSGFAPGTKITAISGNTVQIDKATIAVVTSQNVSYTQASTLNGTFEVTAVPTSTTFRYVVDTFDTASQAVTGGIASYKVATLGTDVAHGISPNALIVVENVDSDYDGVKTVTTTTSNSVSYNVFNTLNKATEGVFGGIIKVGARAVASTFGSFSGNSDIGLEVDTTTTTKVIGSGEQQLFRGSDLRMFGEILEEFSKDVNGFEYRIDCDFVGGQFYKTFTFVPFVNAPVPIAVTNKQLTSNIATITTATAHGLTSLKSVTVQDVGVSFDGEYEVIDAPTPTTLRYYSYGFNNVPSTAVSGGYINLVHPLSVLGADDIVFQYPGNITDFSFTENAEDSATRMWVGGNTDGVDGSSSNPYAAASATDLLGRGWPILDQIEEKTDAQTTAYGKESLYTYAKDFLDEARPPEGSFSLSINGSLDPQVGDYLPGDWCSILVDDDFIRARLANDLEPRADIIVRKITSIKVSVPDSPTFPEKVDLELVAEYKEDRKNAK
jgi:hypothetical protein